MHHSALLSAQTAAVGVGAEYSVLFGRTNLSYLEERLCVLTVLALWANLKYHEHTHTHIIIVNVEDTKRIKER